MRSLVLPLLLAASLAYSVWTVVEAASATPWIRFAMAVERSQSLPPLSRAQQDVLAARIGSTEAARCRADVPQSQVTVAVFLLRKAVEDQMPAAERDKRLDEAERVTAAALRCRPADGNLWYVLALLTELRGAEPQRVAPLFAMSAATAPAEAQLLIKRAKLIDAATAGPAAAENPVVAADLSRALARLKVEDAAAIVRGLERSRAGLVGTVLAGLPEARRSVLRDELSRTPPDRFRPPSSRPVEIDPFARVPDRRTTD